MYNDNDDHRRPEMDERLSDFFAAYHEGRAPGPQPTLKRTTADEGMKASIKMTVDVVSRFYKEMRKQGLPRKLSAAGALLVLRSLIGSNDQR